jgi:hypothetical protein
MKFKLQTSQLIFATIHPDRRLINVNPAIVHNF